MTSEFETVTVVLGENAEKELDKHPDFRGKIELLGNEYTASAWYKTIQKGRNQGQPCVGLSLRGKDVDDINLTLWQKENRASSAEPQFKLKEEVLGEALVFSGWISFDKDGCPSLRIEVSQGITEATQAAKTNRKKLAAFLEKVDGVNPLLQGSSTVSRSTATDGDAEPEDIPFRTTIYRDVRNNRLNRMVM